MTRKSLKRKKLVDLSYDSKGSSLSYDKKKPGQYDGFILGDPYNLPGYENTPPPPIGRRFTPKVPPKMVSPQMLESIEKNVRSELKSPQKMTESSNKRDKVYDMTLAAFDSWFEATTPKPLQTGPPVKSKSIYNVIQPEQNVLSAAVTSNKLDIVPPKTDMTSYQPTTNKFNLAPPKMDHSFLRDQTKDTAYLAPQKTKTGPYQSQRNKNSLSQPQPITAPKANTNKYSLSQPWADTQPQPPPSPKKATSLVAPPPPLREVVPPADKVQDFTSFNAAGSLSSHQNIRHNKLEPPKMQQQTPTGIYSSNQGLSQNPSYQNVNSRQPPSIQQQKSPDYAKRSNQELSQNRNFNTITNQGLSQNSQITSQGLSLSQNPNYINKIGGKASSRNSAYTTSELSFTVDRTTRTKINPKPDPKPRMDGRLVTLNNNEGTISKVPVPRKNPMQPRDKLPSTNVLGNSLSGIIAPSGQPPHSKYAASNYISKSPMVSDKVPSNQKDRYVSSNQLSGFTRGSLAPTIPRNKPRDQYLPNNQLSRASGGYIASKTSDGQLSPSDKAMNMNDRLMSSRTTAQRPRDHSLSSSLSGGGGFIVSGDSQQKPNDRYTANQLSQSGHKHMDTSSQGQRSHNKLAPPRPYPNAPSSHNTLAPPKLGYPKRGSTDQNRIGNRPQSQLSMNQLSGPGSGIVLSDNGNNMHNSQQRQQSSLSNQQTSDMSPSNQLSAINSQTSRDFSPSNQLSAMGPQTSRNYFGSKNTPQKQTAMSSPRDHVPSNHRGKLGSGFISPGLNTRSQKDTFTKKSSNIQDNSQNNAFKPSNRVNTATSLGSILSEFNDLRGTERKRLTPPPIVPSSNKLGNVGNKLGNVRNMGQRAGEMRMTKQDRYNPTNSLSGTLAPQNRRQAIIDQTSSSSRLGTMMNSGHSNTLGSMGAPNRDRSSLSQLSQGVQKQRKSTTDWTSNSNRYATSNKLSGGGGFIVSDLSGQTARDNTLLSNQNMQQSVQHHGGSRGGHVAGGLSGPPPRDRSNSFNQRTGNKGGGFIVSDRGAQDLSFGGSRDGILMGDLSGLPSRDRFSSSNQNSVKQGGGFIVSDRGGQDMSLGGGLSLSSAGQNKFGSVKHSKYHVSQHPDKSLTINYSEKEPGFFGEQSSYSSRDSARGSLGGVQVGNTLGMGKR